MPFDATTPTTLAPYVAYVCSDQGAAVAQAVVSASGGDRSSLHGGGLSGAARLGPDAFAARIVLAEIGNIPVDMACECVSEICRSGAAVIVLGERSDMATYRALRRAGATEYFAFPVNAEDVLATPFINLTHPTPAQAVPAPTAIAKSIAVIGSNGGVGASLLAQNLAYHSANPKGANLRSALLDGDLMFGSQALDLDRDETTGLVEALLAPDRVDATYISATMDHLHPRLSLYSHQISLGQDLAALHAGLPHLLSQLRGAFDAVITDLPREVLVHQRDLAQHLDAVIVVIPAGFAGVNAASRLCKQISAQHPDLRLLPVLSDLRPDAKLSIKDVQTALGRKVVATLPRCDAQMQRAHRAARPMIDLFPRSPYATAIRSLWAATTASPNPSAQPVRASLLKRIIG
ncbi:MAG: AAA family ATPase [Cypionkella sp.]